MDTLRFQVPTVIAVAFTIAVLIGSFVWFSSNTDAMMDSGAQFYLESNARSQAAAFNAKLSNLIEVLEQAGKNLETFGMDDFEDMAARITGSGVPRNFTRVAVATFDGRMVDNAGVVEDVSHLSYFQRARSGETVISDVAAVDRVNGDYLYIALPIKRGLKVLGVMYGQFPLALLGDLIHAVGFQETSTSLLLSGDGTIIARSSVNGLVTNRIANFFDMGTSWGLKGEIEVNDIKIDVISGRTFTVPYMCDSRGRLAILTPVGKNNWYYAIVISQETIKKQSTKISMYMLAIIIAISFAFVTLFVTILHLLRRTALIEETNERFRMVTTQTQAIVFDYDFQKQMLVLNGNVKFIDKNARETYSGDEITELLSRLLHENDLSVLEELRAIRDNQSSAFARELRIKCADDLYYWHRLTGTVVRGESGKPLRLVGNFINVEDEMNREIQLTRKAEIDPLSGLLNKGAFCAHVSAVLADASADNLYAFYIIDLDNFKKVNDTLGHIVGDFVISDVAQKLCTVFSENDFVGRIGGDEFAAFLKLSGNGTQIGRQIIQAKASAVCTIVDEVYSNDDHDVNVTASIGVALFPAQGRTFDDLYKAADAELYKSKNKGKNQYHICE